MSESMKQRNGVRRGGVRLDEDAAKNGVWETFDYGGEDQDIKVALWDNDFEAIIDESRKQFTKEHKNELKGKEIESNPDINKKWKALLRQHIAEYLIKDAVVLDDNDEVVAYTLEDGLGFMADVNLQNDIVRFCRRRIEFSKQRQREKNLQSVTSGS